MTASILLSWSGQDLLHVGLGVAGSQPSVKTSQPSQMAISPAAMAAIDDLLDTLAQELRVGVTGLPLMIA